MENTNATTITTRAKIDTSLMIPLRIEINV